jgi:muramidase (phage lysozyme)
MLKNWEFYRQSLRLPDFGPDSQDRLALQFIGECRALVLIDAGRFAEAITACASRWASLPGAGYKDQHENSMEALQAFYVKAGGTLA